MADVRRIGFGGWDDVNASTSFNTFTLDASTDKVAYFLQLEEAATITQIGFRQGTVTGTAPTYKIGIQGRTASTGAPDGTYLGGGSPASATFTPTGGNDSTVVWITLDNSYAASRGEILVVVVEYASGTIDVSNNCTFTTHCNITLGIFTLPHVATSTGSWTLEDDGPVIGLRSASRSYGFIPESLANLTFHANDSPDEVGIAFTVPDGFADTFNVIGVKFYGIWPSLNGSTAMVLSLFEGTMLKQEIAITGPTASAGSKLIEILFDEATLTDLSPGTEYILAIKATHTSAQMRLYYMEFTGADEVDANPYGLTGLSERWVERTNGGAWSYNAARSWRMQMFLNDATEPAGGGGGGGLKLAGGGGLAG